MRPSRGLGAAVPRAPPACCVRPWTGGLRGPSPAALKAATLTQYEVYPVRFFSFTPFSGRKSVFTRALSFWRWASQKWTCRRRRGHGDLGGARIRPILPSPRPLAVSKHPTEPCPGSGAPVPAWLGALSVPDGKELQAVPGIRHGSGLRAQHRRATDPSVLRSPSSGV